MVGDWQEMARYGGKCSQNVTEMPEIRHKMQQNGMQAVQSATKQGQELLNGLTLL